MIQEAQATIAKEVLARVDSITSKLGIAATQLWSLWEATWWRSWVDVLTVGGILIVLILVARTLHRQAEKSNDPEGWWIGIVIVGIAALFVGVGAIVELQEAITYTINPQLYPLDQLTALLK